MGQQMLQTRENVHVEVLAVEDGLASAVLAASHVKLVLSQVVHLVVGIERANKDLDLLAITGQM
jgi:hypothetical protein